MTNIYQSVKKTRAKSNWSVGAVIKDTVIGAGGPEFDYGGGQIGHIVCVTKGSPPLQELCHLAASRG